jgi:hypothetical protein
MIRPQMKRADTSDTTEFEVRDATETTVTHGRGELGGGGMDRDGKRDRMKISKERYLQMFP